MATELRLFCENRMPRLGANKSDARKITDPVRTITGPVGTPEVVALTTVPIAAQVDPIIAARVTMAPSDSVHCRAAAAGATSIAIMSTTPMH